MDTTLIKGLGLLALLARSPGPRSITDLAQEQGLHKSNVHRVLKTLMHCGFVLQMPDGRYAPTLQLWELGHAALERLDIATIARPALEALGRATGEDVYLATLDGIQTAYIDRLEGTAPMRPHYRIGTRLASYCNAAGKSMLAHLGEEQVIAATLRLKRYTANTLTSRDQLLRELAQIRQAGFAVNNAEREDGVYGVAAPILARSGTPIASFVVILPRAGLVATTASPVMAAARQVEALLRGG